MADEKNGLSVAGDVREELLVSGGAIHERGDSTERELKALAGELGALDEDIAAARAASRLDRVGLGRRKNDEPAAPSMYGECVVLGDAAEILIRPIEPGDAVQLEANLEHLSAMSRYRRFRAPVGHYSAGELRWLTEVDHHRHEALVALDPRAAAIVGVARYVCDPDDRARAHVTYVVTDAWQGRGVGTALVERLAARAGVAGVEQLTALMLVGDEGARHVLSHVADETGERRDGGTLEITARLRRTV
jgi:GNAT superfamily N-acetyltransferase